MKKIIKTVCFFLVQVILVSAIYSGSVGSYANANYKISGYVAPDFDYSVEVANVLKSNFRVEIVGTPYYAYTDSKGYFEINNVPGSPGEYEIKISKRSYLYRPINFTDLNSDIILGNESEPLLMWAGDLPIDGVQDDVINDLDKLKLLKHQGIKGQENYNEDCDLNKDNVINMNDLIIIAKHYENGTPSDYPECIPVRLAEVFTQAPVNTLPAAGVVPTNTPPGVELTNTPVTTTITYTPTPTITPSADPGASTPSPTGTVTLPTSTATENTLPLPAAIPDQESTSGYSNIKVPSIEDFTDMSGHWASKYIQYLLEKRILAGYNNNTMRPDIPITRAEAISLVCRALSIKPFTDKELEYADTDEIPKWAKSYINAAVQCELIRGYEDNTIRPLKKITRAETITIINPAFSLGGSVKNTHEYNDSNLIPSWAKKEVARAYELGIARGYSDNTFRPNNDITRAEFSVMMYNALELTQKKLRV
jgi:hypothetical protein